jgi:hypothetical protein
MPSLFIKRALRIQTLLNHGYIDICIGITTLNTMTLTIVTFSITINKMRHSAQQHSV